MENNRGQWGSQLTFVLAAAGSAVGLGNIWKFPYITGENGGGYFVLIYLVCIVVVGFPIMIAEILIGRCAQRSLVGAYRQISGESSPWQLLGWMGIISGFVILSYYSIVAGWTLHYIYLSLNNFSAGMDAGQIGSTFDKLYTSGSLNIMLHALFMAIVVTIVLGGVKRGIERACKILMPTLIVILLALVVYSAATSMQGFLDTAKFIFEPRFEKLTAKGVLEALGHAFFTLSLGMGAMLVYGSYMSKRKDVPKAALWIVILDTAIALLACFVMFPIVFGHGMTPDKGPGLVFKTMPVLFAGVPGGFFVAIVFFFLLTMAALTSAISVLEVTTSYFIDERQWSRVKSVMLAGTITFVFGLPSALSGAGFFATGWKKIFGRNFFDCIDYLASNWLLTLGGFLIAIYVGWFMPQERVKAEFQCCSPFFGKFYFLWLFTLRFISPTAVLLVILYRVGLIA